MAAGEAMLDGVSARISALAAVMGAIASRVVRGAPPAQRCAAGGGGESGLQAAFSCAVARRLVTSPSVASWLVSCWQTGAPSALSKP